jgi:tungstate transport system substrate-binding protein
MRLIRLTRNSLLVSLLFLAAAWLCADAEDRSYIILASTTSAQQSGLLKYLLPVFTRSTGIEVYVVAVGTGQALMSGERGECDVVLVHDKSRELQFMQNGFGSVRREVMYDDFILVGPGDDPAKINGTHDAAAALRKIAEIKAPFVSRGDLSGTDAAEQRFWTEAGGRPAPGRDQWYLQTGSGMEQTLTTAASMNGYTLTDRATWAQFRDRRHLKIIVDGDPRLMNQYSVILVNPARHPQVKSAQGMAFIAWLTSPEGQDMIASYKVSGEQVFFPDYKP